MKDHSLYFGIHYYIPLSRQKYLINKYQKYIKGIYTSIPDYKLQLQLTHRPKAFLMSYNQQYNEKIIDYARSLGLEINFTLNNSIEDLSKYLNRLESLIDQYQPNELTLLDQYLGSFKKIFFQNIKYVRSFYNTSTLKTAEVYDIYICKNNILSSPEDLDLNQEYRIGLNYACPDTCQSCGDLYNRVQTQEQFIVQDGIQFFKDFTKNYKSSMENYLGHKCWSGYDINQFEQKFKNLKYSYLFANRITSHSQVEVVFDKILENYISQDFLDFANLPFQCLTQIARSSKDFLGEFESKYKNMDMELFKQIKIDYWKNKGD